MSQFEYPRPQMVRAEWTSLNGIWDFAFDDVLQYRSPADDIAWTHTITVPFVPESAASGIGDQDFHPCVWYRLAFDAPAHAERLLLHFGAVDYVATVWLNDQLVARHEGGHTPFSADITDALVSEGRQVLVVRGYQIECGSSSQSCLPRWWWPAGRTRSPGRRAAGEPLRRSTPASRARRRCPA